MGVGDEERALAGDHQAHRRIIADARSDADDVLEILRAARPKRPSRPHSRASASPRLTSQRADDRGIGAHQGARVVGIDAAAAGDGEQRGDVIVVARVVVRIDQCEIAVGGDRQAEWSSAAFRPRRAGRSGSDGRCLPRPPSAPRAARVRPRPRIDHPLGIGLGGLHQRLHDEAGAKDGALQLLLIGVEILDRFSRDAALHRRARDGRGDAQDQARIEGRGDQRIPCRRPARRRHRRAPRLPRASRAPARRWPPPRRASSPR